MKLYFLLKEEAADVVNMLLPFKILPCAVVFKHSCCVKKESCLQPGPDVCNAQGTRTPEEDDENGCAADDDGDGEGNAGGRRRWSPADETPTKRRKSEDDY